MIFNHQYERQLANHFLTGFVFIHISGWYECE